MVSFSSNVSQQGLKIGKPYVHLLSILLKLFWFIPTRLLDIFWDVSKNISLLFSKYWIFKMATIQKIFLSTSQLLCDLRSKTWCLSTCSWGQGIKLCHSEKHQMAAILKFRDGAVQKPISVNISSSRWHAIEILVAKHMFLGNEYNCAI